MKTKRIAVLAFLAAMMFALPASQAELIEIQLDYGQFGHLENSTINGKGACMATSLINSFVYLQNRWPKIYDNLLVEDYDEDGDVDLDDMGIARGALHTLIWGEDNSGTMKDAWEWKAWWIETEIPGKTVFEGMINQDVSDWDFNSKLTGNAYPTWEFTWDQLSKEQDVEMSFSAYAFEDGEWKVKWGHCVTLTSMKFEDDNDDGLWDTETERAWIDYLDSNYPTGISPWMEVWLDSDTGQLEFYDDNYADVSYMAMDFVFAESPVPEPATILLFVSSGLALLIRRRRRK